MRQAIDKWTLGVSLALVLSVLLACKKKDEPAPAASVPAVPPAVSIAPLATAAAAATAAPVAVATGVTAPPPVLGDVKRFPDKEKAATGAVKVTVDNAPVYDEPNDQAPSVASLTKDIFVERIATLGSDWLLVSFPSGVGKLSPGWIEAKSVGAQVAAATHATVAAQTKTATLASAKPATSAPASTASAAPPKATAAAPSATSPAPKPRPTMLAPPKH